MCALGLMDVPVEASSPHEPYRVGFGIRMSPGHMGFTWRSIEKWEEELMKRVSKSSQYYVYCSNRT